MRLLLVQKTRREKNKKIVIRSRCCVCLSADIVYWILLAGRSPYPGVTSAEDNNLSICEVLLKIGSQMPVSPSPMSRPLTVVELLELPCMFCNMYFRSVSSILMGLTVTCPR